MRGYSCSGVATAFMILIVAPCNALAADARVNAAIQRGTQYLRANYQKTETNYVGRFAVGAYGLIGVALLEGGCRPDDVAISRIAELARSRGAGRTSTYDSAALIMFLDRLGNEADRPLIQLLAVRILKGQGKFGGWGYDCGSPLGDMEIARLRKAFTQSIREPNSQSGLHPEVANFAQSPVGERMVNPGDETGDNSNTQFAVLALWIARKHGVASDGALALAEKRFRSTQNKDGGWTYTPNAAVLGPMDGSDSKPSMTCSGLLGLAIGRGVQFHALRTKKNNVDPQLGGDIAVDDNAIANGIKYLENAIIASDRKMAPTLVEADKNLLHNMYFLWSLERVAMIYELNTIGRVDWYKWGSQYLLATQALDGSWPKAEYDGANAETNTALAILFLARANLAKDLTATLKGRANVKLPERVKTDPPAKVDPPPPTTVGTDFETEANRLCNALVSADASRRPGILTQLRDSKGTVFTEGLVRAIAKLQGDTQREARDALALRLKRMTAATLRDMLKDENREIRSAAAAACGLKEDKQYVPDLIAALGDAESFVAQSARISLRTLSGKDFGPNADASAADKATAAAAWRAWWATQGK